MKRKLTEIRVSPHEKDPVPIVADAAISTRGRLGGRLVPLVILDTSNRPDIDELILVHKAATAPGDVKAQWAERDGQQGHVALLLTFVRPMEAVVILEFDIVKQGILVEQILTSKALFIQSGRLGDRFKHDIDRPKVLLEVVDTGFRKEWDELFFKQLTKHFRANGLGRSDSKQAAKSAIAELRKFGGFRMRELPASPAQSE